jgi:predicted nucleotidyltransferase
MATEPGSAPPSSAVPVREALAEALATRLGTMPDVLVAYLFGSQARGTASSRSDVVAVLVAPDWPPARDLELEEDRFGRG